ncbi:hypothetical protein MNBD_GAMMA08-2100 [hydrothermal vent metagenome]|uniref:Kazal-like domain-containing protein n=1 Tax=hydrothermal vent metagenome TaxID=652676 RepID=A0A3B0XFS5_9ZZZZ
MMKNKINILAIFLVSFSLFSCAATEKKAVVEVELTKCKTPKSQICTREYKPVCGYEVDGNYKTFSNACTACSNAKIVSYAEGACK